MKNNYLILIMINVNNQLEQQYQLNPLKKTLSYFNPFILKIFYLYTIKNKNQIKKSFLKGFFYF